MASVRAEIGELAGVSTRRSTVVLLTIAVFGAAISVLLGVYARLHDPTHEQLAHYGFSSTLAMKAWLTTAAVVLAIAQAVTAAWMWGSCLALAGTALGGPRPPVDRHRGVPRRPARRLPLPVVDRMAGARCPRVPARTARMRVLRRADDEAAGAAVRRAAGVDIADTRRRARGAGGRDLVDIVALVLHQRRVPGLLTESC